MALVIAALAVTGCSSDGDTDPGSAPTVSSSPSATATESPAVTTELAWGETAGAMTATTRARLGEIVQGVVDGWFDAAYLGGDYPRSEFADSWPGFTAGAVAQAKRDANLMSNRDIGGAIDGVEPQRRKVALDVVSVRGRPVGVTARVALRFATSGEKERVVRVTGRLYLTRGEQGQWQVFGYDVTKDIR